MCDAGDIIDAAGAVVTGGGTLAYKAITGEDVPGAKFIKGLVTSPAVPKLDQLKPPPPPVDPSEALIRNAMAAERRRAAAASGLGSSFLTGPGGLTSPAPIGLPKAGGF